MRLAIIIPVLDERDSIDRVVANAHREADVVVVVDGGSHDGTAERAAVLGCTVIEAPPGRGPQIAAGIAAAGRNGAEAVLILHADTVLPDAARARLEDALQGGAVGGGFTVRFASPLKRFRFGERVVNLRSRLLRVPLGDQAQFATLAAVEQAGGFPELPILEDLRFIRALAKVGRLAILEPPVVTSTRRLERGTTRTVLTNWSIWALYFFGVPPHRLASLYRQVR